MNKTELIQYVQEQYGSEPEYLWAKDPDSCVFRHTLGGKWYAAVMTVSRHRLGLSGEGDTDILDVKCDPLLLGSMLEKPGCLPGYHMNKAHWLTLLLDGSAADEEIVNMLQLSYELTASKPKKR